MTARPCPACGAALAAPVYRAGPVPVHSCLMLDSVEEAAAFPTGMLTLAPCPACGFAANTDFDPHWSAYAPHYEDQQSFSPTFNGFAGRLARDLVERHGLAGKRAVEIGCSKGDFLYLLAETGAMQGTGIDPSALPGRVPTPSHGSLSLISEYYDDSHMDLPADLLCCRHTLEHVGPVSEMLGRMHRHLSRTDGGVLCLEVPDAGRIWQTGAWEDVYYEHCSYFTAGSLARALRAAGFGVTGLWRDYDDQYLLAEAVADPTAGRTFAIEEDPAAALAEIRRFAARAAAAQAGWAAWLCHAAERGNRVAIWGSGSKCVALLMAMPPEARAAVTRIVDINPHRAGRTAPGMTLPVSRPETLSTDPPDAIVVMNPIYLEEIARTCGELGLNAPLYPLGRLPG